MARVLLINSNTFKYPWPVIPFGLCCVAAALEEAAHQVEVLDLCFSTDCAKDIANAVQRTRPDIIGISIRNIDNAAACQTQFLVEDVRRKVILPCQAVFSGPIVIGGPAVGINGPEMLSFLDLEYAIRGDGEAAIVEFARRIQENETLAGLAGLIIRRDGRIVQDPPPYIVKNLDSLPRPKPHRYLNLRRYRQYNTALPIQTKRGCALTCSYCTYNKIEGRKYRLRTPELVADEIETLYRETGIAAFEFTDSTFNLPLAHTKRVLRAVIAKKLPLELRTMGLNPQTVDEELVDLMKQAGFTDVDLGVEAGCNRILEGLAKNYTTADILRAGRLLHAKKIPITWYLLLGEGAETTETLRETFATITAAASPWDLINIGVGIRVYHGSSLAKAMRQDNPACSKDNFFTPVHVEPAQLSLAAVKAITKQASFAHPNFFIFDEDENTPQPVMKLGCFLMRIFAPRQPLWRLHIVLRTLQKICGISRLKKKYFAAKHRELLQEAAAACRTAPQPPLQVLRPGGDNSTGSSASTPPAVRNSGHTAEGRPCL